MVRLIDSDPMNAKFILTDADGMDDILYIAIGQVTLPVCGIPYFTHMFNYIT